nr:acyltransferase [uncultured Rhodoferax sp.]
MSRLDFLDTGRGIAILGVIAVHANQNFSTGFAYFDFFLKLGQYGVQLFFVISAYTMMHTLQNRIGNENRYIINFWIRRISRIAIPFWAAIVVYQAFNYLNVNYYAALNNNPIEIILSILLMQGFWPSSLSSMVPGGGSIATEVIFYFIFPVIFFARASISATAIIGVICLAVQPLIAKPLYEYLFSSLGSNFTPNQTKDFFYHYIFNQLPVFFGGIFLYQIRIWKDFRKISAIDLISIAIFSFAFLIISTKLAALCLASVLVLITLIKLQFIPKVLLWLGTHSYSMYIFHFAVLNIILLVAKSPLQQLGFFGFLIAYAGTLSFTSLLSAYTQPTLEAYGSRVGRYIIETRDRKLPVNNSISS